MLAIGELCEQGFPLVRQALMLFDEEFDGSLEPIEIVSTTSRRFSVAPTRVVHATRLHDPPTKSARFWRGSRA
jgi:hypothetical protein